MNRLKKSWIAFAIAVLVLGAMATLLLASKATVKEPAVAGAFYPADKDQLGAAVSGYLEHAQTAPGIGRLIALIAPHAGYVYSGQVAAYSYRHITERQIDTVILIGPSHYGQYAGASVYAEGALRTPLGPVPINEKLARSLLNKEARVTFDPSVYEKEHSLEVQLPFLQQTLKTFTVVPILLGAPTRETTAHLADMLTRILKANDNVIIIASTDLSHYHDQKTAVMMDRGVTDAVKRMSIEDLQALLSSKEGEMCGGYPVLLSMLVSRNLGATNGVLYKYANSGDVTGDTGRVVGYAAMGLYQSSLSDQQKQSLLALARQTITEYVTRRKTPEPEVKDERLQANAATFVTINRQHILRGCIGNIQPVMPLYHSVIRNAVSASSQDPRFPPMNKEELRDMEVEITILSPLEPLVDASEIRIGTHGLYLIKGDHAGILLPQVPVEQGWDVPTFLDQVSIKAGLPKGAWKDAQLFKFTAEILK